MAFLLLRIVAVIAAAYVSSLCALPRRPLHLSLFDALIHFIFEGSFLWNCFFMHTPNDSSSSRAFLPGPPKKCTLGDRMSGAAYGTGPFSKLWREYANADRRWGGTDLTVVSLDILTVFVAGPLALWCAEMVKRGEWNYLGRKGVDNSKWFWIIVLATGELYGGQ